MGSVKDLKVISEPSLKKEGIARFLFSDRYSVFDWGQMPDLIEDKGKSLCIIGAFFFEKIQELGIKTHYRGVIEDGVLKKLNECKTPPSQMEITFLRVIKPLKKGADYDYSIYKKEKTNFLIPLEVIYRNVITENSSILRRIKDGKVSWKDFRLTKPPELGKFLSEPILDFSTKLESQDRYLKYSEAKELSGLDESEFEEIRRITFKINDLITSQLKRIGILNIDGKLEFGFNAKRELLVIDCVGTPDECRFLYKGLHLSKEILRIFYKKTEWYREVERAKLKTKTNWKELVKTTPPKLPTDLKKCIEDMYRVLANEITQRKWFDCPSLENTVNNLKKIIAHL